jgi:hypothetical protein
VSHSNTSNLFFDDCKQFDDDDDGWWCDDDGRRFWSNAQMTDALKGVSKIMKQMNTSQHTADLQDNDGIWERKWDHVCLLPHHSLTYEFHKPRDMKEETRMTQRTRWDGGDDGMR